VKGRGIIFQTVAVLLGVVAVAFANVPAPTEDGSDPYAGMYYVWYALIAIVLAWGVYDSFFRPVD